jgi:uncharacterized protein YndB with AHSA1/START domain
MMKTTFLLILAVLVVGIVGVLAYAATKPDVFRVERSATIKAPPERIFAMITDLRGWRAWSPYEKRDPEMTRNYSGADKGKGSTYAWDGNRNVGAGRMEIADVTPPSKVVINLEFLRPFKANNTAEFLMRPTTDGTTVTWAMFGPSLFVGKVMGIFIDMDRMIGKDFEDGLANLKAVAEK